MSEILSSALRFQSLNSDAMLHCFVALSLTGVHRQHVHSHSVSRRLWWCWTNTDHRTCISFLVSSDSHQHKSWQYHKDYCPWLHTIHEHSLQLQPWLLWMVIIMMLLLLMMKYVEKTACACCIIPIVATRCGAEYQYVSNMSSNSNERVFKL